MGFMRNRRGLTYVQEELASGKYRGQRKAFADFGAGFLIGGREMVITDPQYDTGAGSGLGGFHMRLGPQNNLINVTLIGAHHSVGFNSRRTLEVVDPLAGKMRLNMHGYPE